MIIAGAKTDLTLAGLVGLLTGLDGTLARSHHCPGAGGSFFLLLELGGFLRLVFVEGRAIGSELHLRSGHRGHRIVQRAQIPLHRFRIDRKGNQIVRRLETVRQPIGEELSELRGDLLRKLLEMVLLSGSDIMRSPLISAECCDAKDDAAVDALDAGRNS
jgi:hypothetical protein